MRSDYRIVDVITEIRVTEEVRVQIQPGVSIELRTIKLSEHHGPLGRTIWVTGPRIRKDGTPGTRNGGELYGTGWAPQPPDVIRAIVDDAKPGWWA